jgi:type II secretory ATPase GspE/PulE/Tfp pilus assembly ATPase PilB-like protein
MADEGIALHCLTAEGERYELMPEARKVICLTAAGDLYISNSHERSYWVLAFIDKLRREQFTYKITLTSIELIAALYSKAAVGKGSDKHSTRQAQVLELMRLAIQSTASDIHIIVREVSTRIKFRIHGELTTASELSREDGQDLCATIYQTMCDVAEPVFNPNRSQDARLMASSLKSSGLYGGRVATRPTDSGLLMVIRLLYDRGSSKLQLEQLGYLSEQVRVINHMASRRFGINILSGPTGSGKSTTLECLLKRIIEQRQQRAHILTLEDPPEYRIDGAVQTPILCDKDDDDAVSREWARAISNAMRLDPDILMCGEIRDSSSAIATFRAAMTGHGVWTTVHANDALSILVRLQDIGISPSLLGDSALITGLINQVLTKKLCDHCKQPYLPQAALCSPELQARVANHCQVEQVYVRGPGCSQCHDSGINGRTVVAEVIEPDAGLMEAFIRSGKNEARRYWLEQLGGITKNHNLIQLINRGVVDPSDGEQDVCILDDDLLTARRGEKRCS